MSLVEIGLLLALFASVGTTIFLAMRLRRADAALSAMPPSSSAEPPLRPDMQHEPHQRSPLFLSMVAALDAGLVLVDAERQVLFVNQQAAELLDLDGGSAAGNGLISIIRDYQADELVQEVIADGETRETTLQPIVTGRTLRLRCTALRLDALQGAFLLIRDVTQISILERSRRDLVANVSHELRTPLASLKLLVETLQSAPPPPVAQRMMDQMSQEIDAVTQLVDELHQLSQIESGRVALKLAPTPIDEVVERTIERMRPQADRKQLHLAAHLAENQPPVLIDADRIGQVLLNLLHNAVKFTLPEGTIEVQSQLVQFGEDGAYHGRRLGRAAQGPSESVGVALAEVGSAWPPATLAHPAGRWLLVSVHDTGIGIPAQDLPRVFERFYKVDRSRNRNAGGTGLGLAIAKHLVEGHGGRLWAESVEGSGSTFHFTLPLA
ncbi:MAG: cell wall metabolism sensor histidine kinase WalK [Chloroflexaceae bacterium]|jgi:two-component system phosphate regulon sensor histidine kinase PhoR|nr:cell wall metabolism sensor histidine kinase WalK [Chloroflexaceae bacterium]